VLEGFWRHLPFPFFRKQESNKAKKTPAHMSSRRPAGNVPDKNQLYPIGRFPWAKLCTPYPNKAIAVIGKRGAGKSTFIETMISALPLFQNGFACSPTEEANGSWGRTFPPSQIFAEFKDELVENAKRYQILQKKKTVRRFVRQYGREPTKDETLHHMPGFLIVLDDCFYDTKQRNSKGLRELFFNGRHYKFFVVLSLQYIKDLGPGPRQNCDFVFLTKEVNGGTRKKMYEEFFNGMIKSYTHFERIFDRHTENRGLLVFSPCSNTNKVEEAVWYAKGDPEMARMARVCCRAVWAWAKRHWLDPDQVAGQSAGTAYGEQAGMMEEEGDGLDEGVILS
jgi:hypothetical protein